MNTPQAASTALTLAPAVLLLPLLLLPLLLLPLHAHRTLSSLTPPSL
jgi:hypothetical protein